MPTLKILIGEKLVDAEIVVHEGALYARVPDEYLGSSMPLMTAKLEAQTDAVGLLLKVGDLVRAAEQRFPQFDKNLGAIRAKPLARGYQVCRELYEAGKFDLVKKKLLEIRGQIRREMISMELERMAEEEQKKTKRRKEKPKSFDEWDDSGKKQKVTQLKKLRITEDTKGTKRYHMAARFDTARLEAKLFGAEPLEPVGELLDLPNEYAGSGITFFPECSCECDPPSINASGSVGFLVVVRRWSYGSLQCQEQYLEGSSTDNSVVTRCILPDQGSGKACEKIREVFFPSASS